MLSIELVEDERDIDFTELSDEELEEMYVEYLLRQQEKEKRI